MNANSCNAWHSSIWPVRSGTRLSRLPSRGRRFLFYLRWGACGARRQHCSDIKRMYALHLRAVRQNASSYVRHMHQGRLPSISFQTRCGKGVPLSGGHIGMYAREQAQQQGYMHSDWTQQTDAAVRHLWWYISRYSWASSASQSRAQASGGERP